MNLDKKLRKLNWHDITLKKLSSMFFGLFVASFLAGDILFKGRWIFLLAVIILEIKPTIKLLKK